MLDPTIIIPVHSFWTILMSLIIGAVAFGIVVGACSMSAVNSESHSDPPMHYRTSAQNR